MKSNDSVPMDELLLAEMLAEVHHRGLGWCKVVTESTNENGQKCVCALGALAIARDRKPHEGYSVANAMNLNPVAIYSGNDMDARWQVLEGNDEESIGWAFRQAMTVE